MAIKLDLEKAFDRLEWSFIRDTLKLFRFPSQLDSLIMSCVSTTSISILFNGGTLDAFQPLRGIRQGDPLSPYLFISCMKVLGALIEGKSCEKLWNPVKASQYGPAFSHLFFVHNLMLFAKVDRKNYIAIKDVLEFFCDLSRQKISGKKSSVFFSPNVDQSMRNDLCVSWDSNPLLPSENIWDFPLNIKVLSKISDLFWIVFRASWQVGKLTSYLLRGELSLQNQ